MHLRTPMRHFRENMAKGNLCRGFHWITRSFHWSFISKFCLWWNILSCSLKTPGLRLELKPYGFVSWHTTCLTITTSNLGIERPFFWGLKISFNNSPIITMNTDCMFIWYKCVLIFLFKILLNIRGQFDIYFHEIL